MYLKLSTARATITASGPSRSASWSDPTTFAPVEMPAKMPSSISSTSSTRSGSQCGGTIPVRPSCTGSPSPGTRAPAPAGTAAGVLLDRRVVVDETVALGPFHHRQPHAFLHRARGRSASTAPAACCRSGRGCRSDLAVQVVELLDAPDHPEAAEVDLVRLGEVRHVVRVAGAVDQQPHPRVAGAEGVRHARACRAGDHVPGPDRVLVLAEQAPALPLEYDEELLLGRVAVVEAVPLPRVDDVQVEPGQLRAGVARDVGRADSEVAAGHPVLELEVRDVDDVRGPRLRLAELGLARGDLARQRVVARARLGPGREDPGDVRARQVGDLQRDAHAVDEDVEPVLAAAKGVRLAAGPVDDAVALADLVDLAVLPRDPRAPEHVDDLLLRALDVGGSRPLAGIDLEPLQADRDRPGRPAEIAPGRGQVPEFVAPALDVVPVDDRRIRTHAATVLPCLRRP